MLLIMGYFWNEIKELFGINDGSEETEEAETKAEEEAEGRGIDAIRAGELARIALSISQTALFSHKSLAPFGSCSILAFNYKAWTTDTLQLVKEIEKIRSPLEWQVVAATYDKISCGETLEAAIKAREPKIYAKIEGLLF